MNHDHAYADAHTQQIDQEGAPAFWRSRYAIGLLVFGAVAMYFLLSEHRAHFFGVLPFLLLLACPLMHMFMHGGHGGHGGRHGDQADDKQGASSPEPGPAPKTGARP